MRDKVTKLAEKPARTVGVRARRQIETRRRVTEAASEVFREVGYEAATMRTIAARAGVATGTLFLYAPEKRSLLLMILNNELQRATDEAFAALPPEATLLEQIVHVFRVRYVHLGRDARLSLDALRQASFLSPASELDPESEGARYLARLTGLRRRITEIVVDQQQRGHIVSTVDPEDVAAVAMAIYGGESRLWLRSENVDVDAGIAVLERLLRLALSGIMTGPGANRQGKKK